MNSDHAVRLGQEASWPRGMMRVVVLEPNESTRQELQLALSCTSGFQFVGEARCWDECRWLMDTHVPELLVTRASCAPSDFLSFNGSQVFPVIIGLRTKGGQGFDGAFELLDLPLNYTSLRIAIERVRTEIYRRKLGDISSLLQQYVYFSRGFHRFLNSVRAEDGGNMEILAENVVFVSADGNYVRVHTSSEIHEIRDTMSGMTSKLDPEQFARVHRSFIVNRAHVTSVLRKEGAAMTVVLSNGIEVPVGPNYRAEVDSLLAYSRLTA